MQMQAANRELSSLNYAMVGFILVVRRRGFGLYRSFFSLKVYRALPQGCGALDA